MFYGRFEVAGHPGGEPEGLRVVPLHTLVLGSQPREGIVGVGTQWRDTH